MFSLSENVFLQGVLKVKGELAPHSQNLILAKAEHTFRTMACRSWKDLGD